VEEENWPTMTIIRASFFIFLLLSVVTGFAPAATTTSRSHRRSSLQVIAEAEETDTEPTTLKHDLAVKLLSTCAEYGQVGSKLSDEQRSVIDDIAASLSQHSSPSPAKIDLKGKHELIYSASPSASSGALGPLTGKVTQSFLNETVFINRVEFFGGVAKIELYAERKVLDDNKIRVKFKETVMSVFGKEVKRFEAKGSGIWDYVFAGSITQPSGEKLFLRVMNTPSTFVIVQRE
jgi:hypothetical protein